MRRQGRRNTGPELELRRQLWRRGLRYRVDYPVLGRRRRADIVFTRSRVAVFVDGCFWHGCPVHGSVPKANADWWRQKLEENRCRDRDTDLRLAATGWRVIRCWEHEDPVEVADRVETALRAGACAAPLA